MIHYAGYNCDANHWTLDGAAPCAFFGWVMTGTETPAQVRERFVRDLLPLLDRHPAEMVVADFEPAPGAWASPWTIPASGLVPDAVWVPALQMWLAVTCEMVEWMRSQIKGRRLGVYGLPLAPVAGWLADCFAKGDPRRPEFTRLLHAHTDLLSKGKSLGDLIDFWSPSLYLDELAGRDLPALVRAAADIWAGTDKPVVPVVSPWLDGSSAKPLVRPTSLAAVLRALDVEGTIWWPDYGMTPAAALVKAAAGGE